MRWLGRLFLIWAPGWVKARACREMTADFVALSAAAAAGSSGLSAQAFKDAARETGERAAARLKRDLRLGTEPADVQLAWRLVCRFSGMKIRVERVGQSVVFDHLCCPLFDAGGQVVCEGFCLPFVEGMTGALCSSSRVELLQAAAGGRACRKALGSGGVGDD